MPETMTLRTPDRDVLDAVVARPAQEPKGGLVVIHEIWGLTEHIVHVAERFAGEGYVVIAPDILSHAGIAPALGEELFALHDSSDEAARTAAQPRMRDAMAASRAPEYASWAVAALKAAVDWLDEQPGVDGRIGVVGFCFGGTYAFLLAAADERIRAAVPFYGRAPEPAHIAQIHAPVLAFYGGRDESLMEALPQVRGDMTAAGVEFTPVVYEDAEHAFFNDTGTRYDEDAATDAWERTAAFLALHV